MVVPPLLKTLVFALLSATLSITMTIRSVSAAEGAKPTAAAAEQAARQWLDGLGKKGLVIDERVEKDGFVGRAVGRTGNVMYNLQRPGWWITLIFKGEVAPNADVATIRKQFQRVALDRLPTPGLEVAGWEIKPQTPVSSFSKGVEFLRHEDGRIKLRIRTDFFALYGRDPSVLIPADAGAPKSAYFQIRQAFPLDLTLDAPLSAGG